MLPRNRANVASSKQRELRRMCWLCTYLPYNFRCNHQTFTFPLWSTGCWGCAKELTDCKLQANPFHVLHQNIKSGCCSLPHALLPDSLYWNYANVYMTMYIYPNKDNVKIGILLGKNVEKTFVMYLQEKRHVQKINEAQIWILPL